MLVADQAQALCHAHLRDAEGINVDGLLLDVSVDALDPGQLRSEDQAVIHAAAGFDAKGPKHVCEELGANLCEINVDVVLPAAEINQQDRGQRRRRKHHERVGPVAEVNLNISKIFKLCL